MEHYSTPKPMKRIGDLFEKYRTRFKAPQASVEKVCVEVIVELTGYMVTVNQVSYTVSTRTISVSVPSLLKNELRFHQREILKELKNRLGKDGCPIVIL